MTDITIIISGRNYRRAHVRPESATGRQWIIDNMKCKPSTAGAVFVDPEAAPELEQTIKDAGLEVERG